MTTPPLCAYDEMLLAFDAALRMGGPTALNALVNKTSLRHFPCPCGATPTHAIAPTGFPDIVPTAHRRCILCFGTGMLWAYAQPGSLRLSVQRWKGELETWTWHVARDRECFEQRCADREAARQYRVEQGFEPPCEKTGEACDWKTTRAADSPAQDVVCATCWRRRNWLLSPRAVPRAPVNPDQPLSRRIRAAHRLARMRSRHNPVVEAHITEYAPQGCNCSACPARRLHVLRLLRDP